MIEKLNNFWISEELLNSFEEWYDEKWEEIKQLMQKTEEELLKEKFNDLVKEMEKKCTIKLHKYEKYLNIYKDPYEGLTLLNRTPKVGEIFMIDDVIDKLWELGGICDNGDIRIVQLVKEDKETGFIPSFEIWTINPKEHRFWAKLAHETKSL